MDIFGEAFATANTGWEFDDLWGGMSELDFDADIFGGGTLDFNTTEWGIDIPDDIGMDSDIFDPYEWGTEDEIFGGDYGSDLSQSLGASYMSEAELYNLVGGSGAFGEGFMPLAGEAVKAVAGAAKGAGGGSGGGSAAKTVAKAATKVGTKAASNLAKQAISKATSPGGTQGTKKPASTGLGKLGEDFKLPLASKLGGYQAAAPTARAPAKPGKASRAGVEAGKMAARGSLDQTQKWLTSVATQETYSTSYTPSLSKRYSVGAM